MLVGGARPIFVLPPVRQKMPLRSLNYFYFGESTLKEAAKRL
jgi:hypothetical protein